MAIQARCPNCSSVIRAGDKHAGQQVKCPKCAGMIALPQRGPSVLPATSPGGRPETSAATPAAVAPPEDVAAGRADSPPLVTVDDDGAQHWRQVVSKSGRARRGRGRSPSGWLWPAIGVGACVAAIAVGVFLWTRRSDEPSGTGGAAASRPANQTPELAKSRQPATEPTESSERPAAPDPDQADPVASREAATQPGDERVERDLAAPAPSESRQPAPFPTTPAEAAETAETDAPDGAPPETPPAESTSEPPAKADTVAAADDRPPADADLRPEEVLTKHGLRAVGDQVSLTDESTSKLRSSLKDAQKLRLNLREAFRETTGLERQMRDLKNRYGALNAALAQLNATRPGDVTTNNRLVGQLNVVATAVEQLEEAITASRTKLGQARETYIEQLLETRAVVDSVEKTYEEKSADPAVGAALEQLSKQAGTELALAPSGGFARSVRDLQSLEEQILSDAVAARLESGNLFVSTVIGGKHTVEMVVDSGASVVTLPYKMAVACGLEPDESAPVVEFEIADGSRISGQMITIPTLRVGRFTVEKVEAAVLGPEARNATPLLGMSFLAKFQFEIDSDRRHLTLTEVDRESASPRAR